MSSSCKRLSSLEEVFHGTPAPEVVWLFAYGSLMWDLRRSPIFSQYFPQPSSSPDLPAPSPDLWISAHPALLPGYRRRFCGLSHSYRGTPARPGRILGLDQAPPGTPENRDGARFEDGTVGLALCLRRRDAETSPDPLRTVLEAVDAQEMTVVPGIRDRPVYERRATSVRLLPVPALDSNGAGGKPAEAGAVEALTYVMDRSNGRAYVGEGEDLDAEAEVVATARGSRGDNGEYLEQVCAQLELCEAAIEGYEFARHDSELYRLRAKVREIQAKNNSRSQHE